MEEIEQIQKDIAALKARNAKVELDKAWETSLFRKLLVAGLTYVVILIFLASMDFPLPFISAIVPTLGFILSTLTIRAVKQWWVNTNK